MSQPSAYEQYLLELINAERDEAGVQPLAFDGELNDAAAGHSQWMLDTDTFSHTGAGGSNAGDRMEAAGYDFTGSWSWGENIARATTRSPSGFQDEALLLHTNLMNSAGHRANILDADFREIGLGFEIGAYGSSENAMLTENFARSGSNKFLTGVAFDDRDGDLFYDVGEGLGGLTLRATSSTGATHTTTTMDAGGYSLALPAGSYTVTFSGAGIATLTKQITIGTINVKLDLVDPAAAAGPIVGTAQGETLNGTTGADDIRGLGGNDVLYGHAGNDLLDGGTGADRMTGGTGNDTFVVDNAGDRVVEASGQGTDKVNSSVGFSLSGQYIENLALTGSASINGTGNSLNNILTGNTGVNVLTGSTGNDTYVVNTAGDRVIEANGQGTDQVNSSVSFGLGGQYIEKLALTGTSNISALGNSLNNTLAGNSGNNVIDGSTGRDVLTGASGADHFVFSTALNASTNVDRIADYSVAADTIRLNDAVFTAAGAPGTLSAGAFRAGTAAADATDRIIYNATTGTLLYDADGSGAGAAVQFATLSTGLGLTNSDFLIV